MGERVSVSQRFEYHRPGDLKEACRLLEELPGAQVLGGGTDLLVDLDTGIRKANHLVSLSGIGGLDLIEEKNGSVAVGAACTARALARAPLIHEYFPEIADTVVQFASPQVHTRATIGGNICSAVACGDFPVILIALDARVKLTSMGDERTIPIRSFFLANRKTVRKKGEILTQIRVPKKPPGSAACYVKFRRRASNALAVASVASFLQMDGDVCQEARIVLGAVAPTPMIAVRASQALTGKKVDNQAITLAASLASDECKPITDVRATEEFRREIVRVLTKRAVGKVLSQIQGG